MRVAIALMGGFAVTIDGAAVPAAQWRRRQAAALVKLLALAPRARLHRDRVIDALWPDADLDAALPRLHKAAFFAREALGARDAVVVRAETVALFPDADLSVDVAAFDTAADAARTSASCSRTISTSRGRTSRGSGSRRGTSSCSTSTRRHGLRRSCTARGSPRPSWSATPSGPRCGASCAV